GQVQGQVGVPQQLGGIGHLVTGRDADAGRTADDVRTAETVAHLDRRGQGVHDAGGDLLGGDRVGGVGDQDGELVAPHPGGRVARADGLRDAPADRDQQLVADRVPERVVDLLEVVEVDEQHAHRAGAAPGELERLLQPVAEQHPVGQAGEPVVERLVGQVALQAAALGDVPDGQHHARDGRVGAQVPPGALDLQQAPVRAHGGQVDGRGVPAPGAHAYQRVGQFLVVGV